MLLLKLYYISFKLYNLFSTLFCFPLYQCTVSHKQIRFIVSLATLKVWNRVRQTRESHFLLIRSHKKVLNSKGSGMGNYFLRKKEISRKLAVRSIFFWNLPDFPPSPLILSKKIMVCAMLCPLSNFSAYLRSFRCPCNIASYFSKIGVSVSSSSLSGSCVASVSVVTPNGKANKQTTIL